MQTKPEKPHPDYPLFAHSKGQWAKKINGRTEYFGRWDDPAGALAAYKEFLAGTPLKRSRVGAQKPYPEFPLTAHKTGRCCKKVRGTLRYFGPIGDWKGALDLWERQKSDLLAGREPKKDGEITVAVVCSRFMNSKDARLRSGELAGRTLADYYATVSRVGRAFGRNRLVANLGPEDFFDYLVQLREAWGPVAVGNEVQRVRSIFRFGADAISNFPSVRFGPDFKRSQKRAFRSVRKDRMFEPHELRQVIHAAYPQLRAMIMLGVNVGFGNADVGTLPLSALDLAGGWVTYPRPKTGVERRGKLWRETVAAIKAWLKVRPQPRETANEHLVFITRLGTPWHREIPADRLGPDKRIPSNPASLSAAMQRLLKTLNIHRQGLSFYSLRHVHETIGGECRDQVAVNHVMGHADASMSAVYRERVSDERLANVAATVRRWLFAK